jgi:hypothetical protein
MGRILLTIIWCLLIQMSGLAQFKTKVEFLNADGTEFYKKAETNCTAMLSECNAASAQRRALQFSKIKITPDAADRFSAIWQSSYIRCKTDLYRENLLKIPSGDYQLRNIAVMALGADSVVSEQELVLSINKNVEIEDVYFAVEKQNYRKIMSQGISIDDFRRRQMILDFLENFKTAYNRKDLPMLENTFSDNALIIVGKVLAAKPDGPDYMASLGKKKVELVRYNKQQYMKNLQNLFSANHFIDVSFANIEIVQHGARKEIYGVKLLQKWRSTNYSDSGYLFLMIDFEDENKPLIHVRSWQPEKETEANEIIELGDFDVIK